MNIVNFGENDNGRIRLLNTTRFKLWKYGKCGNIWFVYQKIFAPFYACGIDRLTSILPPGVC